MSELVMTTPTWTQVDTVKVDAKPGGFWNLAIEFVPGPRLLRFRVIEKDKGGKSVPLEWTVNDTVRSPVTCGPNGVALGDAKVSYLCPGAPVGALIGKLGGSLADVPDPTQAATPFGTKKVFAVGTYCVIKVADADSGPLYLTMNDEPASFYKHSGALHVEISSA